MCCAAALARVRCATLHRRARLAAAALKRVHCGVALAQGSIPAWIANVVSKKQPVRFDVPRAACRAQQSAADDVDNARGAAVHRDCPCLL